MDPTTVAIVVFVLGGLLLGEIPGLALDRTGVALLGAIALIATGRVPRHEALGAVDAPTLALLFGLMVVSAQFRLGGFYTRVTVRVAAAPLRPTGLLALVIVTAAGLSALLANDIVCLAMTPLVAEGCRRRRLDPVPHLLALACASNVGSAATLIGNPQNMLIGQRLGLSFAGYLADGVPPVLAGLGVVWLVIWLRYRGRWEGEGEPVVTPHRPFDRWQTVKGGLVLAVLVGVFLASSFPRELAALAAAGVLLLSRRLASREFLGLVDWPLLALFASLFVVNHALVASGLLERAMTGAREAGVDVRDPAVLFPVVAVLSNLVSNVPAVMLLLPGADGPLAGSVLALASTFAGNLVLVGSIANLIVVEQARAVGVRVGAREHAVVGVPVTLATLVLAAAWLALRH